MTGEQTAATVLVVEDSLVNRLALVKGVEHEGHVVLQATDGGEALDVLARQPVDMVLLDLVMPDVDGFEVLATMRADTELRRVPVLVISAVEETEQMARAIEMGAIDCLPKPFQPALLRVRLRTALEQSRLRRLESAYLRQELALRQQERLATLGRLSAGLGHELNNPAAAALSTARRLGQLLDEHETLLARLVLTAGGAQLVQACAGLDPRGAGSHTPDGGEAIEATLSDLGVSSPWSAAAELAGGVLEPAEVRRLVEPVGDRDLAVAWLVNRVRSRRAVDGITESVGRMAQLTAALRGYSYLDQAPQQDVDVRRGLEDTLTIFAHKVPAGVTVRREYADDLPRIHAYGAQLNQVWTNLIDNALAAVGERGTVLIRAAGDGDGVLVEVIDDGPGIPSDMQAKVVEPFFTTKPPGEGTGLGLSISRQIVEEGHGGLLTLESRPGRTTLRTRLPPQPSKGHR
ncbi:sensor histidine kinase [Micromonospora sp. WMMD736]|uniref:sensor histidine kinase n=1 Tax=Micromonospora sp. WMMD736 TaxID=3404112 RepID=UPI003B96407F